MCQVNEVIMCCILDLSSILAMTEVMPVMFVCVFNAFPGSTRLVGNVCSIVQYNCDYCWSNV